MKTKRILVVEDEAVTAKDIKSSLLELGYDVPASVASGEDAVRLAAELRPDLILMDITLAGTMSGIQAADEIRKLYAIPIVFLTAHADAGTINKAIESQPFGYLPKPCTSYSLMCTIEVALYKSRVETQLREAEERYHTVADFTYNWEYWITDRDQLVYMSPSCQRITGYSPSEFIADPDLLSRIVAPEDSARYEQQKNHCLNLREVHCNREIEFRIITRNGDLRWIHHVCQPIYGADGFFRGVRASNSDITDLKKMEAELLKARNLESLGILAGGLAHDFNNLLQGLLGNIDMAKIYTPATSKAFPFLKNAELAYSAAINLTNQLIAFSTGGTSVRHTIQPVELIRDAVNCIINGSSITAVFDLPDDLLSIHVDTAQLRQVIGNITLNAEDAMPSGGVLQVSASNETLRSQDISELATGKYIKISIRDQGCGIAPDILPKIFDPYFSTKELGVQKGMGLGLTVSHTIIKKHNGAIKVESETGKGSVFHIYLPVAVTGTGAPIMHKDAAKPGQRVLIMDDESAVYKIAVDYLEFIGYRVDAVTNGDEAIRAYAAAQEAGDPYAAMILDLSIPQGMGGQEAFAHIRGIAPKVKAIVSSGYANDPIMKDYSLYGYSGALAKPYRLEALKEMVERMLN